MPSCFVLRQPYLAREPAEARDEAIARLALKAIEEPDQRLMELICDILAARRRRSEVTDARKENTKAQR
jgi:hypothetical protein